MKATSLRYFLICWISCRLLSGSLARLVHVKVMLLYYIDYWVTAYVLPNSTIPKDYYVPKSTIEFLPVIVYVFISSPYI